MDLDALLTRCARSIESIAPAVRGLDAMDREREDLRRAAERGYFTPEEDDRIRGWFRRYLTARAGLLEIVDDLEPLARRTDAGRDAQLRGFLLAYTAACLLVHGVRTLVADVATNRVVQRKLNEPDRRHRVPRKQYTSVYRSLTSPRNAWRLRGAMEFAESHRSELDALAGDPVLGRVVEYLRRSEESLHVGVERYVRARLRYRWHSWRRRRASAVQQGLFGIFEAFGRVIAEIRNPWHAHRVAPHHIEATAALLAPGDVIVSRHDDALSNAFLPGFWPHASLHVGPPQTIEQASLDVAPAQCARWVDPLRVLEARKDGVLFRALDDTLAVDAFAVLRPQLGEAEIARALERAVTHEGKLYNFDFDFFTADRLVCTEVVYRAYEGIGRLSFPLTSRNGRLTLSAEDLVDMARERRGLEAVAVVGTPAAGSTLVTGADATDAL